MSTGADNPTIERSMRPEEQAVAVIRAAMIQRRSTEYLAVEGVCLFLSWCGDGRVHARCFEGEIKRCLCDDCWYDDGGRHYTAVFLQ